MRVLVIICILGILALGESGPAPQCGNPKYPAEGGWRVVGGTQSKHGAWPWQISLRAGYYGHICGGSIINDRWILSAAHCVEDDQDPASYVVRVGEHSQHVKVGTEKDHKVERLVVHKRHNIGGVKADIVLLKLKTSIKFNDYAKPVCLSSVYDEFESHKDCWVTGWGETRGTGNNNYLQQLQSFMVPNEKCNDMYWFGDVGKGMACFGNGLKGACVGDSGGPLVCRRNSIFYQVGIVSFGTGSCREYGAPGVYTRVSHYHPWIQKQMARYN